MHVRQFASNATTWNCIAHDFWICWQVWKPIVLNKFFILHVAVIISSYYFTCIIDWVSMSAYNFNLCWLLFSRDCITASIMPFNSVYLQTCVFTIYPRFGPWMITIPSRNDTPCQMVICAAWKPLYIGYWVLSFVYVIMIEIKDL